METASEKDAEEKDKEVEAELGLRDLFRPELRRITLVMWVAWPIVTMVDNQFIYHSLNFD